MIQVTIGESKTQAPKKFPKLMIHNDGTITRFESNAVGVHIYSPLRNCVLWEKCNGIFMAGYTDYNEPITIQNK